LCLSIYLAKVRELVQRPLGRILLGDGVHVVEPACQHHGRLVHGRPLRQQEHLGRVGELCL